MKRTIRYLGLAGTGAVLTLALAMGGAGTAIASTKVSVTLQPDGSGRMIANTEATAGGVSWTWQACAESGSQCSAFGSGQSIGTAQVGPGTVFQAIASSGATASSPVWHGMVLASSPPSVSGALRANGLVTPKPATWTGGWSGDFDRTQLAACKGANGTDCTTLTDPEYPQGCPNGAAVIDPTFAGRYLRVADEREGANASFAESGISSPYGGAIWPAGPTTAVAVIGRIASATGPPSTDCGPPPLSPSGTLSDRGVATVHCPAACKVLLRARRGSRQLQLTRRLAGPDSLKIDLGREATRRLGAGTLALAVYVNGARIAGRVVHGSF